MLLLSIFRVRQQWHVFHTSLLMHLRMKKPYRCKDMDNRTIHLFELSMQFDCGNFIWILSVFRIKGISDLNTHGSLTITIISKKKSWKIKITQRLEDNTAFTKHSKNTSLVMPVHSQPALHQMLNLNQSDTWHCSLWQFLHPVSLFFFNQLKIFHEVIGLVRYCNKNTPTPLYQRLPIFSKQNQPTNQQQRRKKKKKKKRQDPFQ